MNIIKKIILFVKKDRTEEIEKKQINENDDRRERFTKSLKVNSIEHETKQNVETLICDGNGLGIQKKITY